MEPEEIGFMDGESRSSDTVQNENVDSDVTETVPAPRPVSELSIQGRRRGFTFEIPPQERIPSVDTSIPHTFTVQQQEGSVISTNWLDAYCPIGSPGRLVIGIDITASMMPIASLFTTGVVTGVDMEPININNKVFLLSTNDRNELVNVFELTFPSTINQDGRFNLTLDSGCYMIEQLGIGDRIGVYVVREPYWESDRESTCSCAHAQITLASDETQYISASEDANSTSVLSNEEKWTLFISVTEDVIALLQTTFRTTEVYKLLTVYRCYYHCYYVSNSCFMLHSPQKQICIHPFMN